MRTQTVLCILDLLSLNLIICTVNAVRFLASAIRKTSSFMCKVTVYVNRTMYGTFENILMSHVNVKKPHWCFVLNDRIALQSGVDREPKITSISLFLQ